MSPHTWNFAHIGGFEQIELKTGEDLARLRELDQLRLSRFAVKLTGAVYSRYCPSWPPVRQREVSFQRSNMPCTTH
jgi:hypothetical protein